MVLGVRVHGDNIVDREVVLDETFRSVPVPTKLGIPLLYKKQSGTGGDDSSIRMNLIVRFMSDPLDGLAPSDWQYGGALGPAPPVVLARKDELPFSKQDYLLIDDFMMSWLEFMSDIEDDRYNSSDKYLQPEALKEYVLRQDSVHPDACLDVRFPLSSTVMAQGLQKDELNNKEGIVVKYSRNRIGVSFDGCDPVALKQDKLQLVREHTVCKPQPNTRTPEAKKARLHELDVQETRAICTRFVDCMHQDTFPEKGEIHLFGVGCDYTARAQDVLAVWQGSVKHQDLTAEELSEHLLNGTMPDFFQEVCKRLADSSTPNSTYARNLIENKFASVEWDSM